VGCTHRSPVFIVPLREINLPSIRLFNRLFNDVSHLQIDVAVSEIQLLERSAIARGCTEIAVQSINMHQIRKHFTIAS